MFCILYIFMIYNFLLLWYTVMQHCKKSYINNFELKQWISVSSNSIWVWFWLFWQTRFSGAFYLVDCMTFHNFDVCSITVSFIKNSHYTCVFPLLTWSARSRTVEGFYTRLLCSDDVRIKAETSVFLLVLHSFCWADCLRAVSVYTQCFY